MRSALKVTGHTGTFQMRGFSGVGLNLKKRRVKVKTNSSISNKQHVSFTDAINFIRHAPMDEVTGFLHMLPSALRTREGVQVKVERDDKPTQRPTRQPKCAACGEGFTKTGGRQKYCKRAACKAGRSAAYQRMHYHTTKHTGVRPNGDAHAMPSVQEAASSLQA